MFYTTFTPKDLGTFLSNLVLQLCSEQQKVAYVFSNPKENLVNFENSVIFKIECTDCDLKYCGQIRLFIKLLSESKIRGLNLNLARCKKTNNYVCK